MKDSLEQSVSLIHLSFNPDEPSLTIETNWYFLIPLIVLIILLFLFGRILAKRLRSKWFVTEASIKIETGLFNYENKVKRSVENLFIANRIYIELVTRKAAMPIDENHDVISEVYDSWYTLFTAIRNEIKDLPGEFIQNHKSSRALIDLTTKILNEGLRPHLTEYQARYRKWYSEQLEEPSNKGETPQEIQRNYPDFQALIDSMKNVNLVLLAYSRELKKLIDG